jgi:polyhydroxyalkanoate synthesis regulator phasin
VKNRILFISIAVVLALTTGLIGCAPSEEEPDIPIGGAAGEVIAAADDSSTNTEDQSQPADRHDALLYRACAIYQEEIGVAIDSEQLKDALNQAKTEMQNEALERRLKNLVDEGKITRGEADQYLEWWQSRPELELPLPGLGRHGPGSAMAGGVVAVTDNSSTNTEDQNQPADRHDALLDRACVIYEEVIGVAIDSEQLKDALEHAQIELRDEALQNLLENLLDEGKMTQEEADQYLEWWQSRPDIELPLPGLGRRSPGGGVMWGGGFQTWDGPRLAG